MLFHLRTLRRANLTGNARGNGDPRKARGAAHPPTKMKVLAERYALHAKLSDLRIGGHVDVLHLLFGQANDRRERRVVVDAHLHQRQRCRRPARYMDRSGGGWSKRALFGSTWRGLGRGTAVAALYHWVSCLSVVSHGQRWTATRVLSFMTKSS